jgi:hypothetical protein
MDIVGWNAYESRAALLAQYKRQFGRALAKGNTLCEECLIIKKGQMNKI